MTEAIDCSSFSTGMITEIRVIFTFLRSLLELLRRKDTSWLTFKEIGLMIKLWTKGVEKNAAFSLRYPTEF